MSVVKVKQRGLYPNVYGYRYVGEEAEILEERRSDSVDEWRAHQEDIRAAGMRVATGWEKPAFVAAPCRSCASTGRYGGIGCRICQRTGTDPFRSVRVRDGRREVA